MDGVKVVDGVARGGEARGGEAGVRTVECGSVRRKVAVGFAAWAPRPEIAAGGEVRPACGSRIACSTPEWVVACRGSGDVRGGGLHGRSAGLWGRAHEVEPCGRAREWRWGRRRPWCGGRSRVRRNA